MSVIDDLLAFDDHDELLDFRFHFGAMPMWPFVRWQLYRGAVQADLGWQKGHADAEPRTLGQRAAWLWRTATRHPLATLRRFDIVIFGTSAGIVLRREGRWFDRINDYFAVEAPERTLVVDASYRDNYKAPRFPAHVRCHDGLPLVAGAMARLAPLRASDQAGIARLLAFVREHFVVPIDEHATSALAERLRFWATRLPFHHWFYQRFFERVRPRVIFVEDGHYGGSAHLLAWAREAGIVTAEFQHGLLAQSHLAYNYGDRFRRRPEFAAYLPQYLLTYGPYWASQVRTPAQTVLIGCPHFEVRRRELMRRAPAADPTLVVLSQGDCTDRMVSIADGLARALPARRIVFRLHPAEVPFVERYERLRAVANVSISDRGDIYDCLREAGAVVGPASTALFEAAGCDLPVFVDSGRASDLFLPRDFGVRFTTVDELLRALQDGTAARPRGDDYWTPDWQERYATFLRDVCRIH